MKVSPKVIYWLPRILCILAILFISVFALDAFDPELSIWQQIVGFLIHLIPSFILIALHGSLEKGIYRWHYLYFIRPWI
jgi:hypothetical protein